MPHTPTIDDFYAEATEMLATFNTFVDNHSLTENIRVDHFCYKCGSHERFESLRALFEQESHFIYQSLISHRRIAVIKLKKGIDTAAGVLNILELSDQKPDGSQVDGFDHIEVLAQGISYEELVRLIENAGENIIEINRPHHITHDIELKGGYSFKLTRTCLIEKIKGEEMG